MKILYVVMLTWIIVFAIDLALASLFPPDGGIGGVEFAVLCGGVLVTLWQTGFRLRRIRNGR